MGLFTRTKRAADPEVQDPERKIILNFGSRGSQAILDIAAATLEAGGYTGPPREPDIGDEMPDGTICAGISPDTHKPMYATPADAPLTYTFNEAQRYAKKLDAHGHQDWRVPTEDELSVLFNNLAAIRGFNVADSGPAGWYWSSSPDYGWTARCQRFSDGYRTGSDKDNPLSVRCLR